MINLLYAALGTLGFGILFNANKNKFIYIMIGGFLNYLGYMLTFNLTGNIFLSSGICAIVTSVYSNVLAKILKCPSTIFILTGLIPSVPGSSLFYTMQNIVLGNSKIALAQGIITIEVILGIVSGILFASVFDVVLKEIKKHAIIKIRKGFKHEENI